MKKTLHLCLLTILSLFILTGCKEDPEAMNNIPTLILEDPTDLTRTSVTLHGSIKTNYPQQIKEYGFRFSSSIDFSSSDTRTIPVEEGSLIDVSTLLTDLNIGETYFYVLYVSTGGEPLLSDVQSLIMPTRSLATLTEPQQVAGTLTFEATITDDGGSPINSVGFCWSTTPNPTIFTGEHLFADFTEETTFSATLNQLETSTTYYVRAFAESDVTGSGTMALAYSPSITLQTAEAPTLRPYELATGVTSLTFGIEAEHAETICWKALPKSEYKGTLSAGEIIDGGNSVPGAEAGEVRCEGLNPDTEYVVVAAAENGGFSTVSTPLEMKTRPVPTIKTALGAQTPLSVTCSIATTDGDMVKWLLLPIDDSKEPESITPEVLAEQGMDAEVNTTALVSCEDLTPETHYILHAAVWSGDYAVQATPLRMMTSAKPTISLTAGSCTAESITFSVTSANADQVHWMILPQSALNQPYEITAEMVLGSENTVAANQTVKVTATDLTPETTYTIYAAAEKEGVAVLSDKLELTTTAKPVQDYSKVGSDYKTMTATKEGSTYVVRLSSLSNGDLVFYIKDQDTIFGKWLAVGKEITMESYMLQPAVGSDDDSIKSMIISGEIRFTQDNNDATKVYVLTGWDDGKEDTRLYFENDDCKIMFDSGDKGWTATMEAISVTTKFVAQGINSLEFSITSSNADKVTYVVLSPEELAAYGTVTAQKVLTSKNSVTPNREQTVKAESLTPETTYTIYAAAEKAGVAVLSDKLELTTTAKPTVTLKEVARSVTHIEFSITSSNADLVHWMILPQSALNQPYEITAEMVLGSENTVAANQTVKVTATDLTPETTYTIYAAAEKEGIAVLSDKLELTTTAKPTVTLKEVAQGINSLEFTISSSNADKVAYVVLSPEELAAYGAVTVQKVLTSNKSVTPNQEQTVKVENLTPETTYTIYAAAEKEGVAVLSDKLVVATVPETWKIIYYTSTDGKIVTPFNSIFGAKIVSNVYENGKGVITFDGPVTTIGNSAFRDCAGLKTITIPNHTTVIGDYAFYSCSGLTTITIPDGVTTIGDSAFQDCAGLKSAIIGNVVSEIGSYAFGGCDGLTNITIPDSVTTIGNGAFGGCDGLTNITIPDSVTTIGNGAFESCSSLTTATIPESVKEIGNSAFSWCTSLTSVTIGNSITKIDNQVFYKCSGLTSVTIPDSVTEIGRTAFGGCSGLKTITIPDGVTKIENGAFIFCDGLTSVYCKPITPPTGVDNMFLYNASDRKIYVPRGSVAAYKAAAGWSDYADAIYSMDGEEEDEKIPETWRICYTSTDGKIVTPYETDLFGAKIVSNTYENGQGVITFDGPVTTIGNSAFRDCAGLKTITIPNHTTVIGDYAFEGCDGLTSVTIPDGVTEIGHYSFCDCTGLTSVYCMSTTPPTGEFGMFNSCGSGRKIYVPKGSVAAYKAAPYWSDYADAIVGYDF